MATFVDIHAIQSLPPSNPNRDGEGRPKTCEYGGRTRMRVSSQAWKKSMRDMFRATIDADRLGSRSREFTRMAAARAGADPDDERFLAACGLLMKALGLPADKQRPGCTSAMQFIGNPQWDAIAGAAAAAAKSDDPAGVVDAQTGRLRALLDSDRSIDVALFGRMSASDEKSTATLYVTDAACMVAHAIGVGESHVESDYFTAVDECDGAPGAGMVGDAGFTSATLYRYACVDVSQLSANLAGDQAALRLALERLVNAFALSMPDGKRNAFAQATLPALVMAQVRHDRPVNLVEAFASPVRGDEIPKAARALLAQLDSYTATYGLDTPDLWTAADAHARAGMDGQTVQGTRMHDVTLPVLSETVAEVAVRELS